MHGIGRLSRDATVAPERALTKLGATPPSKRTSIRVGLKDWRVLHAVVDCGTFASAADVLNMSQPAVSYTVAKLEQQIGMVLFRQEGRKACLTPMGRALAERSRALVKEAYDVEEFAANLMRNWQQDIRLLVDKNFPAGNLIKVLQQFANRHSYVNVALTERSTSAIEQAITEGSAELAITSRVPCGAVASFAIEMHFVPVAHPDHPLFRLGRAIDNADLAREQEVRIAMESSDSVLSIAKSQSQLEMGPGPAWLVHSFDTATSIVVEGLAYGWLPRNKVSALLEQRILRILPLQEHTDCVFKYYLVGGCGLETNIEVKRLATMLQESLKDAILLNPNTS